MPTPTPTHSHGRRQPRPRRTRHTDTCMQDTRLQCGSAEVRSCTSGACPLTARTHHRRKTAAVHAHAHAHAHAQADEHTHTHTHTHSHCLYFLSHVLRPTHPVWLVGVCAALQVSWEDLTDEQIEASTEVRSCMHTHARTHTCTQPQTHMHVHARTYTRTHGAHQLH